MTTSFHLEERFGFHLLLKYKQENERSCISVLRVSILLLSPIVVFLLFHFIKGRSPYNGKLSDFSFYIDSQISVHRKLKNRSIDNLETQKKYISMKNSQFFNYLLYAKSK
jgi:hypothetical protein